MPGHKGIGDHNECLDITEITGADSLYEASGIIAESEKNASALFDAHTRCAIIPSALGEQIGDYGALAVAHGI